MFSLAVALYVGATVASLVLLIIALVLMVIVVIVIVKRWRRRNVAVQRRYGDTVELQSAHDSRLGDDDTLGGYETIPGIKTGEGPAHVQREGLYEELPGETKVGVGQ